MKFTATKKIIAAAAILLLSVEAGAQKMITFESRPTSSHSRSRRSHEEDGKNSLTMGVASMINGYIPFYYERRVAPVLTVQVGAGITFRSFLNDFGQLFYTDGEKTDYFLGSNRDDIIDKYENYKYRKMKVGQYLSISPKVYFRESALNGVYIAPMVEYKQYRYEAQLVDETERSFNSYDDDDQPRLKETMDEHMTCIDYTFNFGGHFQTGSHVAVGFNVGIGGRSISAERLDIGSVSSSSGDWHLANATRKYTATRPLVVFNFIIGGWF